MPEKINEQQIRDGFYKVLNETVEILKELIKPKSKSSLLSRVPSLEEDQDKRQSVATTGDTELKGTPAAS
mgnify:CR=1 FL=1|tara:strand:- start:46 stop:255 length:210 start_codon:yes stop_codon:yes gene_type:complete